MGSPGEKQPERKAHREPLREDNCRSHPNLFSSCFVLTLCPVPPHLSTVAGEGPAGQGLALTDRAVLAVLPKPFSSWQETGKQAGRGDTAISGKEALQFDTASGSALPHPTPPTLPPHVPLSIPAAGSRFGWRPQMLLGSAHPHIHTDATLPRPTPTNAEHGVRGVNAGFSLEAGDSSRR